MGVLSDSWCFCKGGGKSERMKASLFATKGPAVARISGAGAGGTGSGTGFVIHRNLLLTTHALLPSVTAAEAAEIRLRDGVAASLFPHRFFITSSILDLTAVALDKLEGESSAQGQPHYLKTCSKANLDLGSTVYFLGYAEEKKLTVGEGKVIIATDNLIKLSTDEITWSPGSAGFDAHGNLAFMICDPMKLATSPNTKSSTTSSSSSVSCKRAVPMQFGIPMLIICDWLNQHWEGGSCLDELNKPKLPLIRLMSTGQKSDHSSASFTLRRVFKPTEAEIDRTPSSSSNILSIPRHQLEISSSVAATFEEETLITDRYANAHVQGIPSAEIYESPKLTALSLGKKESSQVQLLDINFPPQAPPQQPPPRRLPPSTDENRPKQLELLPKNPLTMKEGPSSPCADAEMASTGSVNGAQSEVESSSSPVELSRVRNGYSSEGETMYSAETTESRNYTSPREVKFHSVGRSQSCASYGKWGAEQRNPVARRGFPERQQSSVQGGKMYSTGATSQRSNDYFTPTVSSIMKKRNSSEEPKRCRQNAVHSSPRWMF